MKIIHTETYLRSVKKLFSQKQLAAVDEMLVKNALIGDVIPQTYGLRKARFALDGRGKRGGARIVYYYWQDGECIYLIYAYSKNQKEDMSPSEKKYITEIAAIIKREIYENQTIH